MSDGVVEHLEEKVDSLELVFWIIDKMMKNKETEICIKEIEIPTRS